ncbi:MAG TPA: EAL domain-containing protein [Longimicrobiaceae bacterium]|nr:EAL domain-containing protein [Longimicrobiaceae bacterium]
MPQEEPKAHNDSPASEPPSQAALPEVESPEHEINNALAVVMAQAQLFLAEEPGLRVETFLKQGLETIYHQGRRIAEIMRENRLAPASALAEATSLDSVSSNEFRSIVESLPDGVLITDCDLVIRYANPRMYDLLGMSRGSLSGVQVIDVIQRLTTVDAVYSRLVHTLSGGSEDYEVQLHSPHADAGWLRVSSVPLTLGEQGVVGSITTFADITRAKQTERSIRESALLDPLTGLPNRTLLVERITNAIARARRHAQQQYAVLFLDLDRLKRVNDSFGHAAGDELLIEVASRLRSSMRPEDTIARIGGDEFAILLEGIAESADATRVAQRIQQDLATPIQAGGYEASASASIGIVLGTAGYETPEQLLRDADTAMYRAKSTGRGRYEIFDRELHRVVTARLRDEAELRRALDGDEFRLHYQPIVALGTSKMVGIEALLRWQHPERGMLYPDDFIPLAESSNLILPIGRWTMSRACSHFCEWREQFGKHAPAWVAVNLSSKQFLQPGLVLEVQQVLSEFDLGVDALRLEINESTVSQDRGVTGGILAELGKLGVCVNVDDFGTGLSSLSNLHQLPIEAFKIDRPFVHDLRLNIDDHRLVRTILTLAEGFGASTIAEGVSTEEQLGELIRLGCQYGQGYLFSRPLTSEGVSQMIERTRTASAQVAGPRNVMRSLQTTSQKRTN